MPKNHININSNLAETAATFCTKDFPSQKTATITIHV